MEKSNSGLKPAWRINWSQRRKQFASRADEQHRAELSLLRKLPLELVPRYITPDTFCRVCLTHKRPDVSRSQLLNMQEEHDIKLFASRCTAAAQTTQQKMKQSEVLCWSSDEEYLPDSLFSSLVWTQGHASTSHPGHTRTMQLRVSCSAQVMC